jgi:hypothetical protein
VACAFLLAAGALVILAGWLAMAAWVGRTSRTSKMTGEQPDEPDNEIVRHS